jgi:hypothetical protein
MERLNTRKGVKIKKEMNKRATFKNQQEIYFEDEYCQFAYHFHLSGNNWRPSCSLVRYFSV